MAYADAPGPTPMRSHDSNIAAAVQHGVPDASLFQQFQIHII